VAYESRKLTAAERNYPGHVLELLALVHALRAFRHYLLGGGAPRPAGCWSDFDLRTDNQAIVSPSVGPSTRPSASQPARLSVHPPVRQSARPSVSPPATRPSISSVILHNSICMYN
jgi:hypothetical protein